MREITSLSACALAKALAARRLSAVEVAEAYLAAMRADGVTNAYITQTPEMALAAARAVDVKRAAGEALHPLAGVPAGIKDNICVQGAATTCASNMLRDYTPPYTATAARRLQDAGVPFLGKLNMDEFAMGSTSENSAFGPVKNPRDPGRVPGGSSGGSAAAVAAGLAAFALGSDTGGSIRQPAAFCGVVGFKPTYGRVSRSGLVAFASSLDQIGPITRTVRDSALVLSALCGHDPLDSTSLPGSGFSLDTSDASGVKGLRIGLPAEYFGPGIAPGVRDSVLAAARRFGEMGAVVEETSLPAAQYALPAYYVLSSAEASSNLARFDGVRYGHRAEGAETIEELYKNSRSQGFGAEVKRRILLGTFVLSAGYYDAYYKKAQQARTLIMRAFDEAFQRYDLLLTPAAPTTAYRLGEKSSLTQMYHDDLCTVPVNIAGLPAISLPCGQCGGLPVGMQLIGRALDEAAIYRAALAYEAEGGQQP